MTPTLFRFHAIEPAYELLPANMASIEATALLIAIALQESRLKFRRQIGGPAHSYLQFERGGGVHGVLTHAGVSSIARQVCAQLDYAPTDDVVYEAMEHNDVLACAFGRLLLWTVPGALPLRGEHEKAWYYYTSAWRPGKPHRETWDQFYDAGWAEVLR